MHLVPCSRKPRQSEDPFSYDMHVRNREGKYFQIDYVQMKNFCTIESTVKSREAANREGVMHVETGPRVVACVEESADLHRPGRDQGGTPTPLGNALC